VNVGCSRFDRLNVPFSAVDSDMRFHIKVPLVGLLV